MRTGYFSLFLLAVMLSACGPLLHVPSKVPEQFESLSNLVEKEKTSRREVHELYGRPFISDNGRRVEVYRVLAGREAYVYPFWIDTEEVIFYALIVYDERGIIKAIDKDIFDSIRGAGHSIGGVRGVKLRADGFIFMAMKEGAGRQRKELLLAPPTKSQDTIARPPPENRCAVLYFFSLHNYDGSYFVDREKIGAWPLVAYYDWGSEPDLMLIFAKVIVTEGEHQLSFTASGVRPKKYRGRFECKPGQTYYAQPNLKLVDSGPSALSGQQYKYEGGITISPRPQKTYEGWKRLLFYNGKWLGED